MHNAFTDFIFGVVFFFVVFLLLAATSLKIIEFKHAELETLTGNDDYNVVGRVTFETF